MSADNPRDVVVVVAENHVGAKLRDALPSTWPDRRRWCTSRLRAIPRPTFAELIDGGHRLVVLADGAGDAGDGESGLPRLSELAFATTSRTASADDLGCDAARGTPREHALFIVLEWLGGMNEVTDAAFSDAAAGLSPGQPRATDIDRDPFLTNRVKACENDQGHVVNIIDADFYDRGDLVDAVVVLNRSR